MAGVGGCHSIPNVPLGARRSSPCLGRSSGRCTECSCSGGGQGEGRRMPGAEFPAAPSRLSGASISGPGHSQNFLGIPTLAPLGQSPGRAEVFLSPAHQAWDRPQKPRGHFKMLCVMETFKHSLQSRTHSDLWAILRFTVTQATLTTCPRPPTLLDLY